MHQPLSWSHGLPEIRGPHFKNRCPILFNTVELVLLPDQFLAEAKAGYVTSIGVNCALSQTIAKQMFGKQRCVISTITTR